MAPYTIAYAPPLLMRRHACVQVSCIYGLGMPSKYLEASIRVVRGQEWTGGLGTLTQHLEQVHAPLQHNYPIIEYTLLFLPGFQLLLYSTTLRAFYYAFPAVVFDAGLAGTCVNRVFLGCNDAPLFFVELATRSSCVSVWAPHSDATFTRRVLLVQK